jgi:hypothetical protein
MFRRVLPGFRWRTNSPSVALAFSAGGDGGRKSPEHLRNPTARLWKRLAEQSQFMSTPEASSGPVGESLPPLPQPSRSEVLGELPPLPGLPQKQEQSRTQIRVRSERATPPFLQAVLTGRIRQLCCSRVLVATKRMFALVTASQMASASAASFFRRLT